MEKWEIEVSRGREERGMGWLGNIFEMRLIQDDNKLQLIIIINNNISGGPSAASRRFGPRSR